MVDVDEPATWPSAVADWANDYAQKLRGSTLHTSDLAVPLERKDELRSLLEDYKLLAFHCTRLLDHEVAAIRQRGLRVLSHELVSERIANAYERGLVTDEQRDHLQAANVFAIGAEDHREGQVCLVLGRSVFDESPSGCEPLLSTWGGEGIYALQPEVRLLGRPAIVLTGIDLSVSHRISPTFPSLGKLFVGTLLGTEQRSADVFLRSAIPPADVLGISNMPAPRLYRRQKAWATIDLAALNRTWKERSHRARG